MTQSTSRSLSRSAPPKLASSANRDRNAVELRSHTECAPPYCASKAAGNGATNSTNVEVSLSRKVRKTGSVNRISPNAPPRKTRNRKVANSQVRQNQGHRSQALSQALRRFPTARVYSRGLCSAPGRIAVFAWNDQYWLGHRIGSPTTAGVRTK